MILAAWSWDWHTSLAALVAFVLGWFLYHFFGRRFGKKHEEVLRRVVETSSDESTRIRTLADEHASALKLKDDALLKLRGEHESSLAGIRSENDKLVMSVKDRDLELGNQRVEATRLQGLVGSVDTGKAELDDLKLQLSKQKADYELTLGDWRKRAETSEAAVAVANKKVADLEVSHNTVLGDWQGRFNAVETAKLAAEKKVVDLDSSHKVALGDWQTKFTASESKATEVQGLMGSAQADNDRVLADWRKRAEAAELSLTSSGNRVAELEARVSTMEADHSKVVTDWTGRVKDAEAKQTEIQGLVGSAKSDNEKVVADWRGRYSTLETELTAARSWETKYNGLVGERDALRGSAADWEAKYHALSGELDSERTNVSTLRSNLAEATAGPDDLLLIEGIGPKINQALRSEGFTRWIHVRDASQETLKAAIEKGGVSFAPSVATWSKQAAYLVDGDMAGFKQYTEYLIGGVDPAAHGGETLTGDAQVQALAGGEVYGSGNVEVAETDKNSEGRDNLLIIEGIGPKFNEALLNADLDTFAKVAGASEGDLRAAIELAGLNFAPSLTTWAQQAELLAKGDRAGFDALVARLVAGRDEG